MKRLFICLILAIALSVSALANSGPTYVYSNPGLEMAVDAGCPIAVSRERLTFDFTGAVRGDWSPVANVTAAYDMTNPSDKDVSVSMAFPFITSLMAPSTGVSSVSVDGEIAPFKIYYGRKVSEKTNLTQLNLNDVLSNVTLQTPEEPKDGMVYTVKADTSALPSDTTQIFVRMKFDAGSGECYMNGFTGMSRSSDGTAELIAALYMNRSNSPLTVFVPGGGLTKYDVGAFDTYDSDKPIKNVGFNVEKKSTSLREYVEDCRLLNGELAEAAPQQMSESVYWALLQDIHDNSFAEMYGNIIPATMLLSSTEQSSRLAMAVYTVDFLKGETKEVTVKCTLGGTMDRPSGYSRDNAKYSYTYLSNPAKEWASFGALSLTVIPPGSLSLTSSVPALARNDNGNYTAELQGLPESNISFTLSEPATKPAESGSPAGLVILLLVFAAAAAAAIVLVVRHTKKRNAADERISEKQK